MPKYRFICPKCYRETLAIVTRNTSSIICDDCKATMNREMPRLNVSEITETVNKYLGTKQPANRKDQVEERRSEYYWKHEVPRFVDSGTYSLETMIDNGWVIVTDDGKIEIQNKPPHRR